MDITPVRRRTRWHRLRCPEPPLYRNLSAADLIHETRNLNRRFDQRYAEHRLDELAIPMKRKAGTLSGGQQAQLALTLALARRPQLLVLDEPMAALDPIARRTSWRR